MLETLKEEINKIPGTQGVFRKLTSIKYVTERPMPIRYLEEYYESELSLFSDK